MDCSSSRHCRTGLSAYVIIEEYVEKIIDHRHKGQEVPVLIVLSAKNEDRLSEVAKNLHAYLTVYPDPATVNLLDLAYTLQIGREAMESRLALVVDNFEELVQGLDKYLNSKQENKALEFSKPIFLGNPEKDNAELKLSFPGKQEKLY